MKIIKLRKGKDNPFFGKKHSSKSKEKMRLAKLKNPTLYWLGKKRLSMTGKKHPLWKGDNVSYRVVHSWVQRTLGKAKQCVNCGTIGSGHSMHWANKDHTYRKNKKDWLCLCPSCHAEHDRILRTNI